jgi:hypothetical protein
MGDVRLNERGGLCSLRQFLSKSRRWVEKAGERPDDFQAGFPNVLDSLSEEVKQSGGSWGCSGSNMHDGCNAMQLQVRGEG